MRRNAKGFAWTVSAIVMVGTLGVQAWGAAPKAAISAVQYQVFAWNDLGMHCYDSDFSIFAILPPFNVAHAQVVQKGKIPLLLTSSQVGVVYLAATDPNGSINTTSGTIYTPGPLRLPVRKTNFWDHTNAPTLFGFDATRAKAEVGLVNMMKPPGLVGANMPGTNNTPQSMTYDKKMKWFTAFGIPITDLDNSVQQMLPLPQLRMNPYPLMRFQAIRKGKSAALSSIDAVLPVSSEMACADCHATGLPAADKLGSSASTVLDVDLNTRENIVKLHDSLYGTQLWLDRPVLCASCHYSKAVDLLGKGPQGEQQLHQYLSWSMHGHHAASLSPENGAVTCYKCHPGSVTNCLRGVMGNRAGIVCQDCHGDLIALSGKNPLKTTGLKRQPWADLPKCQSCHTGDAVDHPNGDFRQLIAYDPSDPSATAILAPTSRFAENPNTLYRFSTGHGGMACSACHGSPHAEWPARNPASGSVSNDNRAATQAQGHQGPIIECGACHTSNLAATLRGPHGMHNVNSQLWIGSHGDMVERSGFQACQACHGLNLLGTGLSIAAVDRTLQAEGKTIHIAAGGTVSCTLCHENPLNGNGD